MKQESTCPYCVITCMLCIYMTIDSLKPILNIHNLGICICVLTHLMIHYCFKQIYDCGLVMNLRRQKSRGGNGISQDCCKLTIVFTSSPTHHHVQIKCTLGIEVLQLTQDGEDVLLPQLD